MNAQSNEHQNQQITGFKQNFIYNFKYSNKKVNTISHDNSSISRGKVSENT